MEFCYRMCAVSLLCGATCTAAEPDYRFFEQKIRPVLVNKCYKCHSAQSKDLQGGLLLDTREGIRRGGESGHAVVPGNLKDSLIVGALKFEDLEMPPDEQLPASVIADFEKWILQGAPDPRDGKSVTIRRKIDIEAGRKFWSFQPLRDEQPPTVKDRTWPLNAVDRFVLARLESQKLTPVADCDPGTLVRRVYFDLVGLPPTPGQVRDFVADPSPDALRSLVDRLLDSPQFGERWGRHWLDAVRYAESTGMERNYTYPYAWRYRDYVIAAFNDDMPFDQFLIEQLAGDLLPAANRDQRDRQLIATALLTLGPKSLNETNRERFTMDVVDEQIDVTTRAFLGLTASCARCHDHKFDPIPSRDYYALAGIFRSTRTFYGTSKQNGNRQPGQLLNLGQKIQPISTGNAGQGNLKKFQKQLRSARKRAAQLKKQAEQNPAAGNRLKKIRQQIARLEKRVAAPAPQTASQSQHPIMAVLDANNPADTAIRIRGEANAKGPVIDRGFLSVLTRDEVEIPDSVSGRLELARWMTDEQNPLTARVAANRFWQHLFGRGLVGSVNNFGLNGDRPTHPRLLDYLARQLRENGWSVKRFLRSVMLSRVYRLSSSDQKHNLSVDPENRLLWRMNQRRLECEALRDAMLAVSGQLDRTPGHQSLVMQIGDGAVGRSIQPERFVVSSRKRSVYLPIVRGEVPEMLRLFDFPEPSNIAGQREETTVPAQALFMLNSPFVLQQSQHMARRLLSEATTDTERVARGFQLAFSRAPSPAESRMVLEFLRDFPAATGEQRPTGGSRTDSEPAWAGFCQMLLAAAEFRYLN